MTCPVGAVEEHSSIFQASQKGFCSCETNLVQTERSLEGDYHSESIECECVRCPLRSSSDFAYECNRPITGACSKFSCDGVCTGDSTSQTVEPPSSSDEIESGSPPVFKRTVLSGFSLVPALYFAF